MKNIKGQFVKGTLPWNAGTGKFKKCQVCNSSFRIQPNRLNKYCSQICRYLDNRKESICKNCSKTYTKVGNRITIFCSNACQGLFYSGEKHFAWKGGISSENEKIRKSKEYKFWRKAVFERDNYTCIICRVRGIKINADHIKPFALYPELRLSLNNGRTLCVPCHKETPTYGGKKICV